jgi:hypothetical protein
MAVHFEVEYVAAVGGLLVGAFVAWLTAGRLKRADSWDARLTLPLVLAAGAAHVVLIPVVELQRQVLFALYFVAMAGVFTLGALRLSIWRAGAVIFPAGSIFAYFYFAAVAHEADVIGLVVKVVEAGAIAAAIGGALMYRRRRSMA